MGSFPDGDGIPLIILENGKPLQDLMKKAQLFYHGEGAHGVVVGHKTLVQVLSGFLGATG